MDSNKENHINKSLKNQYLVALNNEVNQILGCSMHNNIKFHHNVPDPHDQDPVEQLEYIESCISKKQFVLVQFIKIYLVVQQQGKLNIFNLNLLIKNMEIALKGQKVLLTPKLIRDLQIPKKIQCYFREYGEMYK